jgi:Plasmid pRiA4b ORF-3-like protein
MTNSSLEANATELAAVAQLSPAFARACELASWVGEGRTLTASGVLRPSEAVQACRALGIDLPGSRLRSALDVWELMRDWTAAVAAGLIEVDGRQAWAAPERPGASGSVRGPHMILTFWLRAAMVMLDLYDEPCTDCLTVLHQLRLAAGPVAIEQLVKAVAADLGEGEPETSHDERCPDCGQVHDDLFDLAGYLDDEDEDDSGAHTTDMVLRLLDFGALANDDGVVELTPLGGLLAESVLQRYTVAPDADAGAVISALTGMPSALAGTLARNWLNARSASDAARQLMTFAESANGQERLAALAFARELGIAAADGWRDWAKRPEMGAYARQWLAELGEQVAIDPADDAWLTVDTLWAMMDTLTETVPAYLVRQLMTEQLGDEGAEAAEALSGSGHPRAADLVAMLAPPTITILPPRSGRRGRTGSSGAPGHLASAKTMVHEPMVYQLKVTLRGVSKPPVWRRVLVPADITLNDLHSVIQLVMGWGDSHLHVFSTDWQEYGSPDGDLGHVSDKKVRLEEVLTGQRDRLRYTYDFGDDWEHDVVAEQTLVAEPGQDYPRCTAGKGACPPEDCGGAWGYAALKEILADASHEEHEGMLDWLGLESGEEFDPTEFSAADADSRLRPRRP